MTAQPANAPENPSAFLNEPFPGMTLRDYFAGQVLAGQESTGPIIGAVPMIGCDIEKLRNELYRADAAHCYRKADAMLAERSRREGKS